MASVTIEQARKIVAGAFAHAASHKINPLAVAVLDAGARLVAYERQDGASPGRYEIAFGKANGHLERGAQAPAHVPEHAVLHGQPARAVLVGVASPHRSEAFRACRYIIDEIKLRLPIWKKEYYADGSAEWVNCRRCSAAGHHAD